MRGLRQSFAFRFCLVGLLTLHFAYLTRFTYLGLDAAPDCPVMGVMSDKSCCPTRDPNPDALLGCSKRQNDQAPSNTPKSEDCPTCQKFTVFSKVVCAQHGPTQFVLSLAGSVTFDQALLIYIQTPSTAEARGPPTFIA